MKIITHNDHDGKAAASVIACGVGTVWDHVVESDITYYAYGKNKPDIDAIFDRMTENEILYITDLSICPFIKDVIIKALTSGHKVVHIDHHKTTLDALKSDEFSNIVADENYIPFVSMEHSATMLCYIYYLMTDEERNNPSEMKYDTTVGKTHLMFNNDTNREYGVPLSVRYIDDRDLFTNNIEESKYFANALGLPKYDLSPVIGVWRDLILSYNNRFVKSLVEEGMILQQFIDNENEHVVEKGVEEIEWEGYKTAFINVSNRPTSETISSIVPNYDLICMYYKSSEGWKYSLRSNANSTADCEAIAMRYGGGGHVHASGFTTNKLLDILI